MKDLSRLITNVIFWKMYILGLIIGKSKIMFVSKEGFYEI